MADMTLHERYALAQAQLDAGQPREAARTLEPAAEELAGSASAQLLLGRAYFGAAQLAPARRALERLVALDPTDAYGRFLLGRVAQRAGDDDAVAHLRLAVALDPRPEYRERLAALG